MKKAISAVTIFSTLMLIGCGGDEADFAGGETTTSSVNSFDGTWSQGCQYDQISGIAELSTLEIKESSAILNRSTFNNDSCSDRSTSSSSLTLTMTYPGQLALNDCINTQNVNTSINYPVIINDVEFSEDQFNALPSLERQNIRIIAAYDLLCVNQNASLLYTGEKSSRPGTSANNRPNSANITAGLNRR